MTVDRYKWEYKHIVEPLSADLEPILNGYGKDGWFVKDIYVAINYVDGRDYVNIIMEREIDSRYMR